ncbi:MAG: hypothetical protein V3S11_03940 [Elusimicrobiota bacterium]
MKRKALIAAAVLIGAPAVWFAFNTLLRIAENFHSPSPVPIATTDRHGRPFLR